MDERKARAMIAEHFRHAGRDEVRASEIYSDDAVLEFPQGRERLRGKANILAMRTAFPVKLRFVVDRVTGQGDLWVNEYTITYGDDPPQTVVGIMEFSDSKVVRERIYITEPWVAPAWRAQWVEPMD